MPFHKVGVDHLFIRILGAHNEESKHTKLTSLLIDDKIAIDAGSLVSEITYEEQEKIKTILLSHGHYDHIRGIPSFAFNNRHQTTKIYATTETFKILSSHLIDGVIYPEFTKKIPFFLEKPSLKFYNIEPFNSTHIDGYKVVAIPVNHTIYTIGFEITNKNRKKAFYSSDTGPGLSAIWEHINPDLLIIETTFPNKRENRAINSAHLCPKMLKKELIELKKIKEIIPKIYLIHLSPRYEKEIRKEIKEIEKDLNISINICCEGDKITV
ncbi:MAG: MBL fold metallo-hydrolase [Thermoplasmatales archaeon]|jgi:ribonuclease BN (tRNA processing enzyme)|nr:MAG: MBL fold metallo-hydrolase [Thermoplasmatales archaeon]